MADTSSETVELTADIVAAYVSNADNALSVAELPGLINRVHHALTRAATGVEATAEAAPTPAVSIKKSVTPDYLISLEDGRRYKSLKRHLGTRGLSPEDYRAKWGLPRDYPMVAPNYSAQRSSLAKSLGLGRGGRNAPAEATTSEAPAKARGGKRKTETA